MFPPSGEKKIRVLHNAAGRPDERRVPSFGLPVRQAAQFGQKSHGNWPPELVKRAKFRTIGRKETVSITSTTIQTTTMQKYGELTSEEENYAKTLLAYVANSPSNDYSKMSESDIVNILSSCYKVKENYPRGKDLFPTAKVVQNTGMPQVKVSQKDFQKASENIFGKELSDTAKSNSVDLKNGYYYFNVPMDGHTYKLEVQNMQYSEDKSKITVTYTFNSGTTGEEDSTNEAVFVLETISAIFL